MPKFRILILSKKGTEEEANDCFFAAMISVFEMAIGGTLNIAKTIEDYVFIIARNNWYKYLNKKNNFKRGDVSSNENSEYEESHIISSVSNKNEILKDEEDDMNDKISNISITSFNRDIDIIKKKVYGNNDSDSENYSSDLKYDDLLDNDLLDDNKLNDELSKNIDPIMDDHFQNLYKQVEKILDAGYPKCKLLFEQVYFYKRAIKEIVVILNYADEHSVSTNLKSCHYRVKNRLRKMRISLY